MPSRGQAKPRRGISVSSRRGWGPGASGKTMKIKTKDDRRVRIQLRQRKRIAGSKERPRLSVFRSVTHIYAQVIDDLSGQTLVSASSVDAGLKGAFGKGVRRRQRQGRRGDRQGDRRAIDREGHQARRVRPQRIPVSRPHSRRGGRRAESRFGVLGRDIMRTQRTHRSIAARHQGHGGLDQPRHQGRQGRQEPELQRARRRRRRPRRGRLRRRQGEGSAVGDQEGHRGGQEEPDSRPAAGHDDSASDRRELRRRAACC